MLHIYVDADACPVKTEVCRVADRYDLEVTLVANAPMRTPAKGSVHLHIVGDGFDAADNWIVAQIGEDDIVITGDIPLASRCIEKGARALGPSGRPFSAANIGQAVATRDLMAELRVTGEVSGGPAPRTDRDRSRFLQELDKLIHSIRKDARRRDLRRRLNG